MKRTNSVIVFMVLTMIGHWGFSQIDLTRLDEERKRKYPDTLILRTESQIQVNFAFHRMSDKRRYLTNELWKSILATMSSSVNSSAYTEGVLASYKKIKQDGEEVAKIEVSPLDPATDIFVIGREGMVQMPANRIEFKIYEPYLAVSFFLTDLSQLEEISELNMESVWDQIDMKYKNYGKRDVYRGKGVIKFGNANIDAITSRSIGTDAIEFSSGVGLAYIRDRFVPDLSFKMAFNIPDRLGRNKTQFGLLYTQHVFFEEQAEKEWVWDNNGFLSGFYSIRFLGSQEVGIAMGALVLRNGDYFQNGTYKFSFYTSSEDSDFSFGSSFIFTDNFKQAIPVVRVGFTF